MAKFQCGYKTKRFHRKNGYLYEQQYSKRCQFLPTQKRVKRLQLFSSSFDETTVNDSLILEHIRPPTMVYQSSKQDVTKTLSRRLYS